MLALSERYAPPSTRTSCPTPATRTPAISSGLVPQTSTHSAAASTRYSIQHHDPASRLAVLCYQEPALSSLVAIPSFGTARRANAPCRIAAPPWPRRRSSPTFFVAPNRSSSQPSPSHHGTLAALEPADLCSQTRLCFTTVANRNLSTHKHEVVYRRCGCCSAAVPGQRPKHILY